MHLPFCWLLQVIARCGRWLRQALYLSYLKFFKPEGLLAAGGWETGSKDAEAMFWAERFCVVVSDSLVALVFPFLGELKEQVAELGKDATTSMLGMPQLLDYLGRVVVQDALELAEEFPDNPVHAMLLQDDEFRYATAVKVVA
jgi:hypothetical protein